MSEIVFINDKKYLRVKEDNVALNSRGGKYPLEFWDSEGRFVYTEKASWNEKYYLIDGIKYITRKHLFHSGVVSVYLYIINGKNKRVELITEPEECVEYPNELGEYLLHETLRNLETEEKEVKEG